MTRCTTRTRRSAKCGCELRNVGLAGILLLVSATAGCVLEQRIVFETGATTTPQTEELFCKFDRNSWRWNMTDDQFEAVLDDLTARAKEGNGLALVDLAGWHFINRESAEIADPIADRLVAVYGYLGFKDFRQSMWPCNRYDELHVWETVMDRLGADEVEYAKLWRDLDFSRDELPWGTPGREIDLPPEPSE